jgi:nicotinate-nucleotide adenylyltransferase
MRPLVVLGGTFDPPHRGHFALLRAAAHALAMRDDLRLLIAADPWQKQGVTPAPVRLEMLQLALKEEESEEYLPASIDTRELQRVLTAPGPTYAVDSLRELRAERGADIPIVFVIGWDQWLKFDSWHEWQHINELAHLCIAPRPNAFGKPSEVLARWAEFRFASEHALREQPAGLLYQLPMFDQAVSSTQLRADLRSGRHAIAAPWLHAAVLRYIQQHHLYEHT